MLDEPYAELIVLYFAKAFEKVRQDRLLKIQGLRSMRDIYEIAFVLSLEPKTFFYLWSAIRRH